MHVARRSPMSAAARLGREGSWAAVLATVLLGCGEAPVKRPQPPERKAAPEAADEAEPAAAAGQAKASVGGEPEPPSKEVDPEAAGDLEPAATAGDAKAKAAGRKPAGKATAGDAKAKAAGRKPAGKAVDGLRIGLWPSKESFRLGEEFSGTVRLENVGSEPLLILPSLMHPRVFELFEVIGPDGKPIPYSGPQADWVPDYDEEVVKLAPGDFVDKEVTFSTRRGTGYDLNAIGEHRITGKYHWKHRVPPPNVYPGEWKRGPMWTGTVRSNTVTIKFAQ